MTTYLPDSLLASVASEIHKDIDLVKKADEAVWDSLDFHNAMLAGIRSNKFDLSWLNAKKIENSVIGFESANLEEMFKPTVAQPNVGLRKTQAEKKKEIRERRREYQKELQEKIKYGLVKPPPPKLRIATFWRTLGNEAVADPTAVEQKVKKMVEDRQKEHIEKMESRKLTKEQKQEKFMKKLKKDSSKDTRVGVYLLPSIGDYKTREKILKNAQQLALNGLLLVPSRDIGGSLPIVLVAEAGPRYIKFFKRLLFVRIPWQESSKPKLVWEGSTPEHVFPKFKLVEIHNELEGRKELADRKAQSYWDSALGVFESKPN